MQREDYSDDDYSSPRRRRKRRHESEQLDSKEYSGIKSSRLSDSYDERSVKRMKVRSRSSHQENGRSRSSYDESEMLMESSSRRSKRADRHHTEHHSALEKYGRGDGNIYGSPGNKKKRSGNQKPVYSAERPTASDSRKSGSKRKSNSSHPESDIDEPSPRKAAASSSGKSKNRQSDTTAPPKKSGKKTKQSNKNTPNKLPVKRSATASTKPPPGVQGDEAKEPQDKHPDNEEPVDNERKKSTQSQQVNPTRDPLYWLAGGENSSDEESWDFDGPMILPPPPI